MADMNLSSNQGQIRYLTPLDISTKNRKKYCRFKRLGICLLYTSPSPRDLYRSRMPSSA